MGSSNGITRGQLRPHFSGRSPPFLLAALCVGLGILGVSYWSLSQQYNDLEEQLKKTLIRKDSIESDMNVIQNQLNIREEEYSTAKQKLQKDIEELNSVNNDLKTKTDQINDLNSKMEFLTKTNTKCHEELSQKSNDLGDAVSKLKDIEQQKEENKVSKDQNQEMSGLRDENKRLEKELNEIRQQLFAAKNNTKSDTNIKPVVKENIENNMNDFNSLKATNISVKSEEQPIKEELNPLEETKPKLQEPPNVESNQLLSSNALAEEDRKEESLVEANEANNEVADEFKSELNKEEDMKLRSQI